MQAFFISLSLSLSLSLECILQSGACEGRMAESEWQLVFKFRLPFPLKANGVGNLNKVHGNVFPKFYPLEVEIQLLTTGCLRETKGGAPKL